MVRFQTEHRFGAPEAAVSLIVPSMSDAYPPVTRLMTLLIPGLVVVKSAVSPVATLKYWKL